MLPTTLLNTPIKPELVPMMMGTPPPTGPIVNSCTSVTTPATNMALCSSVTCRSANSPPAMPQALVMINSGVKLPTNMAQTCCRPSGMACFRDILASN